MDTLFARISESFNRQGLMETLGGTLRVVEPGRVVVSMPFSPGISQQHGFAHGGSIAALGDTACGFSALTLMPDGKAVLTSEFKINLLAPAAGERFEAEGKVIRAGKRLHVVQGDVYAINGDHRKHIAILIATMMVMDSDTGLKN